MAVLKDINQLSIWDLAHYWHGYDPKLTTAKNLPVRVQQIMRALALKASKGLYLRCTLNGFAHNVFNNEPDAVAVVARVFQRELKYAYTGRKYKKKFLSGIDMSRKGILIWCKQHNESPPSFWFDSNDPILDKPIEELVSPLSKEQLQNYGFFPMFFKEPQQIVDSSQFKISNQDTLVADQSAIKAKNEYVVKAISEMNSQNAKKRYIEPDKEKERFVNFYSDNKEKYKSKRQLIIAYFDNLSFDAKIKIVPSYDEKERKHSINKAYTNLIKLIKD